MKRLNHEHSGAHARAPLPHTHTHSPLLLSLPLPLSLSVSVSPPLSLSLSLSLSPPLTRTQRQINGNVNESTCSLDINYMGKVTCRATPCIQARNSIWNMRWTKRTAPHMQTKFQMKINTMLIFVLTSGRSASNTSGQTPSCAISRTHMELEVCLILRHLSSGQMTSHAK